jgi:hypothetical protein
MTRTPETRLETNRDGAIAKIRASRNRKIYIHVSHQFQSVSEPGFGYNLSDALQVNAAQAEKWLRSAISDSMVDKVIVEMFVTDYTMFIS